MRNKKRRRFHGLVVAVFFEFVLFTLVVFGMGSWPTPQVCDGVVPSPPGPRFLIRKPLDPAVGENEPSDLVSVKEMTQQVCLRRLEFVRKNIARPDSVEKAKSEAHSRFVQHLCVSEGAPSSQSSASGAKVARGIVRGLDFLQERTSAEEACASQELVQGLHAELFRLHDSKGVGQLRTCNSYSRKGNDIHWFPPPHVIPSSIAATLKKHNYYISKKTTFANQHTPEYVDFVCRCTASLLYDFVELHPFKNGNGLVAHLLASSVLRLVAPLPVIVPMDLSTLKDVNPDTTCLERDSGKLAALAVGLLEGLHDGWEWFAEQLDLDK